MKSKEFILLRSIGMCNNVNYAYSTYKDGWGIVFYIMILRFDLVHRLYIGDIHLKVQVNTTSNYAVFNLTTTH